MKRSTPAQNGIFILRSQRPAPLGGRLPGRLGPSPPQGEPPHQAGGGSIYREEQGFDSWNLYRGRLKVLRATGVYTQLPGSNRLALQVCGLDQPFFQDTDLSEPGQTAFYLVAGVAGGVEGDLGTDSSGNIRPNDNPCP